MALEAATTRATDWKGILPLTVLAILAFACNSLLTRAAIGNRLIGSEEFTMLRLGSGALALLPFLRGAKPRRNLSGGICLFAYAAAFSLAYEQLPAATGALLLFAAVQATILGIGVLRGMRMTMREIAGALLAFAGLVYLFWPGVAAPAPLPAATMAIAGLAWVGYTLTGRNLGEPAAQTAWNFVIAALFGLLMLGLADGRITWLGGVYAVLSGVVTSGLGYAVWYTVAPRLSLVTVAVVQLMTPIAAALGGWLLLYEALTFRLAVSTALVLLGILLASLKGKSSAPAK